MAFHSSAIDSFGTINISASPDFRKRKEKHLSIHSGGNSSSSMFILDPDPSPGHSPGHSLTVSQSFTQHIDESFLDTIDCASPSQSEEFPVPTLRNTDSNRSVKFRLSPPEQVEYAVSGDVNPYELVIPNKLFPEYRSLESDPTPQEMVRNSPVLQSALSFAAVKQLEELDLDFPLNLDDVDSPQSPDLGLILEDPITRDIDRKSKKKKKRKPDSKKKSKKLKLKKKSKPKKGTKKKLKSKSKAKGGKLKKAKSARKLKGNKKKKTTTKGQRQRASTVTGTPGGGNADYGDYGCYGTTQLTQGYTAKMGLKSSSKITPFNRFQPRFQPRLTSLDDMASIQEKKQSMEELIKLYVDGVDPEFLSDISFDKISVTKSNEKTMLLSSKPLRKGRHKWSLDLLRCDVDLQEIGVIGTCDIERIPVSDDGASCTLSFGNRAIYGSDMNSDRLFYGSWNTNNKARCHRDLTKHFNKGWTVGDTISVDLNLDENRIKFMLNGHAVRYMMTVEANKVWYPMICFSGNCKYFLDE